MSCCAVFCKSRTTTGGLTNPDIAFHTFPKCPEIRKQWIKAVRRENWEPNKHSRLCSKHFESSSYVTGVKLRKLRTEAVPTIFEGYTQRSYRKCRYPARKTGLMRANRIPKRKPNTKSSQYATNSRLAQNEVEEWMSWPDVCRCCLAARGVWDLTASYAAEDGETEVYLQMLADCYGIKLSHVSEFGPSRLVCAECVASLRRANSFKRQVLQAQEKFAAHYGQPEDLDTKIKEEYLEDTDDFETYENDITHQYPEAEVKEETESIDQESDETPIPQTSTQHIYKPLSNVRTTQEQITRMMDYTDDECDDETPHRPSATLSEKRVKDTTTYSKKNVQVISYCPKKSDVTKSIGKSKLKGRGKKMKIQAITSAEIDATIENLGQSEPVQIGPTNLMDTSEGAKSGSEVTLYGSHSVKTITTERTMNSEVKQVSERQRIKLTCQTVLGYTTACPFRHRNSWFQCFYCTLQVMEINLLRDHIAEKHTFDDIATIKRYPRTLQIDITEFQCKICGANLTDVADMIAHFSEVHDKVAYKECIADYKVNVSPYTCHLCGKDFHVFRTLTTHLNEHYANCICDICGKSFINSKRLKVHKRTHQKGIFPCDKCGKVLKTMTSKANHMDSHLKRVIKCHICLKIMKHYNDRVKHMSEAHNVTHQFKCHICGKEYNIKHYLATHMRQTHGHKNKKCAECGMAFVTNHGLKKHMLKHSGVKAFSCVVCNKSYARSYTLREHMRVHDGDKFVT